MHPYRRITTPSMNATHADVIATPAPESFSAQYFEEHYNSEEHKTLQKLLENKVALTDEQLSRLHELNYLEDAFLAFNTSAQLAIPRAINQGESPEEAAVSYSHQSGIANGFSSSGERPYQEDFFSHTEIEALPYEPQMLGQALYDSIRIAGRQFERQVSGCAFVATLQYDESIITAWLGDAAAFLIWNEASEEVPGYEESRMQSLTVAHSVENERDRITVEGGEIIDHYLNGQINMARSFGDASVGNGHSNDPDITITTVSSDNQPRVMLCSDGVTDSFAASEMEAFFTSADNDEQVPKLIVEKAMQATKAWALHSKSEWKVDNTTVLISPQPCMPERGFLSCVADGHNGELVAKQSVELIPRIFKQVISFQKDVLQLLDEVIDKFEDETCKADLFQIRCEIQYAVIAKHFSLDMAKKLITTLVGHFTLLLEKHEQLTHEQVDELASHVNELLTKDNQLKRSVSRATSTHQSSQLASIRGSQAKPSPTPMRAKRAPGFWMDENPPSLTSTSFEKPVLPKRISELRGQGPF